MKRQQKPAWKIEKITPSERKFNEAIVTYFLYEDNKVSHILVEVKLTVRVRHIHRYEVVCTLQLHWKGRNGIELDCYLFAIFSFWQKGWKIHPLRISDPFPAHRIYMRSSNPSSSGASVKNINLYRSRTLLEDRNAEKASYSSDYGIFLPSSNTSQGMNDAEGCSNIPNWICRWIYRGHGNIGLKRGAPWVSNQRVLLIVPTLCL